MKNTYIQYYKNGDIQRIRTLKSYAKFRIRIARQTYARRLVKAWNERQVISTNQQLEA